MWHRIWIWQRKLKTGKVYCPRWYDARGRMRTETVGTDPKLAERMRTQKEADLNSGKVGEVERTSFDAFMSEELEVMEGRLSESSVRNMDVSLRHFGRICRPGCVADIKARAIEAFLPQRLREVRPATANKPSYQIRITAALKVKVAPTPTS